MAETEIERRTVVSDAEIEYREVEGGEKQPVIVGYAAVFNSESRNLGGFIETVHPNAFDEVLSTNPDVLGVFNHDKNMLLGRTANGRLRLSTDPYGLRYEITPNPNTSVGRDVIEWVKDRTVVGSSFAFAVRKVGGDTWNTGADGLRRREIRSISLLDDVGPVTRPAYEASSVVVSRRAIEMALGDSYRPNQTMANASRKGLRAANGRDDVDQVLVSLSERLMNREILSIEEVAYLAEVHKRCHEVRSYGWSGNPAWVEWMLAGGDSGERWVQKRHAEPVAVTVNEAAKKVVVEPRAEPGELSEGDFASWGDGEYGRVEHVMPTGSIQGMEASEDDPIAVLTPFDDGEPEDYMVAKMVSELTKVEDIEGMDEEDGPDDRAAGDKSQSTPAPKEDQITGSDKNAPGSAKGASSRIAVSEAVRTALRNKVRDHNEAIAKSDKPAWSRTTLGQLLSVYRRGAGAYSTSHRPGVSRGAWAMARVNAYLYLLRNGNPQDSKYVTDNDLLPNGHPRSTRSEPETDIEVREVNLRPSGSMASAARRGLRLHEQGKSGDGLKPETVARAKRIAAREELTPDHVREMNAWFARHEKASKSPGWDTPGAEKPGFVAWLLWSGNAGQRWSAAKVAQMEREGARAMAEQVEEVAAQVVEVAPVADGEHQVSEVASTPAQQEPIDPMSDVKLKIAELNGAILRTRLQGVG